ncbi:unnamed protein product [Ambrosiozyma monospora]|uniref:Unnamed protein product n=1 Tax=Ambrosiozyma monospora TaxID=43982 RepID=A0A9W6YQV7_AMBMO|nr:unnamed protein product [Ambrosiozyma monospora]
MVESFSLLCFHGPRPIKPQPQSPDVRHQDSGLRTQESGGQRPDGRRQSQSPDSRVQAMQTSKCKVHLNTANRPPALNSKLV